MTPPRVSVVMATYDWSSVLPYSIGSVLDQTIGDLELLVVGDGCTDDSEAVVRGMDDPRVRWHDLGRNTGHQSGPNNEGLRLARARVVAYLGHDDLWLPHHLETLVPVVERGEVLAHASSLFVVPGRQPWIVPAEGWSYSTGAWIVPTSVAHAREPVVAAGGWRRPAESGALDPDGDLWSRLVARHGDPVHVDRLTSVKFPADSRPGVYRTRPHHEQEAWLGRIRAAADPEAELRALAGPHHDASWDDSVLPLLPVHLRVRAQVLGWWRDRRGLPRVTAAERLRYRRLVKGADSGARP